VEPRPGTPPVIVFDVNETLSDLAPLSDRFVDVGAPAWLARLWFAALLRDGFALAAAGGRAEFAAIGAGLLGEVLREVTLTCDPDEAIRRIMDGFAALSLHPDVAPGIRELNGAGFRLVTLSNGSTRVAQTLLSAAGIRDQFDALLTVEDAPAWKPARAAYDYAAAACAVRPADMLLVAVHPWDINGAAAAGLRTAWLNRSGGGYPSYFAAPDHTVGSLSELAARLGGAT
jgi:2-haloacid dehalogenase